MTLRKPFALSASLALLAGLSVGCEQDKGSGLEYCEPTADAGDDQSVSLGLAVVLDGSGSGVSAGCEAHELTYEWSFESVPAGSEVDDNALSDNNSATAETPEFLPDLDGAYVVSLVVCDDTDVCSDPDVVVITTSAGDAGPVADAGPDQPGEVDLRVALDGSGSYDPDGDPLTYSWSLTDAPDCSSLDSGDLYDATTVAPSIVPDCAGTFQVSLVVSDGDQWSEPDYALITVSTGNALPVADAGDSTTIAPCDGATITLDGTRSYDPEGEVLEYEWSLVSRPKGSAASDDDFDDPTLAQPSFSWDVSGDYTFQLQVFDGESWSAPDVVHWTMIDAADNNRPEANAGEDQSVEVEAECTSESYVFTCEDCESQEFIIDGSASSDEDGDELSFLWSEASGEAVIKSPNTAVTSVVSAPIAAEHDNPITVSYDLTLTVADCELEDDDTVRLSVTCTGSD